MSAEPAAYAVIAPGGERYLVWTAAEAHEIIARTVGQCIVRELVLAETLVRIIETLVGQRESAAG